MKKIPGLVLIGVVLAGCVTYPTFNPNDVGEAELVDVSIVETDAENYEANWAIVAIDGIPIEIHSNGASDDSNGVTLPIGTHVFTIKLANGQVGRRSLYYNQEIDIVLTFEEADTSYQLAREATFFGLGETSIVLRTEGPVPLIMNKKVDEVILTAVGINRWEVQE